MGGDNCILPSPGIRTSGVLFWGGRKSSGDEIARVKGPVYPLGPEAAVNRIGPHFQAALHRRRPVLAAAKFDTAMMNLLSTTSFQIEYGLVSN